MSEPFKGGHSEVAMTQESDRTGRKTDSGKREVLSEVFVGEVLSKGLRGRFFRRGTEDSRGTVKNGGVVWTIVRTQGEFSSFVTTDSLVTDTE